MVDFPKFGHNLAILLLYELMQRIITMRFTGLVCTINLANVMKTLKLLNLVCTYTAKFSHI